MRRNKLTMPKKGKVLREYLFVERKFSEGP